MDTKKGFSGRVLVSILMMLFLVSILLYGISNTNSLFSSLKEVEVEKEKEKLKSSFNACFEPLNKGEEKNIRLRNSNFNTVCVIGEDFSNSQLNAFNEFEELKKGGDNVVILNTALVKKNGKFLPSVDKDYTIIDSFSVEGGISKSGCWNNLEDDGDSNTFNINLICT